MSNTAPDPPPPRALALRLGAIAILILAPVTMPVPVLRGLVQERFGVSDLATSLFMSVNMLGALLAAPLAGAIADRIGWQRVLIIGALAVDAACFFALTLPVPFGLFLAIRFVEGCAHIFALSLLLSLASEAAPAGRARSRVMGAVGGGLTFGVAIGAPIGGWLGRGDPLMPLHAGAVVLVVTAIAVAVLLPAAPRRRARQGLRSILEIARRESVLAVPYAFAFVDRFTVGFFTTIFTLYLKNVFELPVERIGLLLGLFLGPFALLSYPCSRLSERVSRSALVVIGSLGYGAAVATLGWWDPAALPILMLSLGVLSAAMFVPSLLMVTDLAPAAIRSTALGAFNAAGSLGFMIGPLVGAAVSDHVGAATTAHTGYATAFVVAGGAEVICVLLTLPALRRLRRAGRIT